MVNRSAKVILALLLSASVLSACGDKESSGKTTDPKPTANASDGTVNNGQPIELVVTSSSAQTEESFNANYAEPLKKKFPNVNLKYIKKDKGTLLVDLLTAGQPLDLIFESSGGELESFIPAGVASDITDLIKKHNIDLSRFEQTSIDLMKNLANGGLYGLPVQNLVMGNFYNKDLFDKFGVAYPKDGMTWDDTLQLAKKFDKNDNGTQYLGLVVSPTHYMRLNQFSVSYVDSKTEKSAVSSNDKWKQILQTAFVTPAESDGYKKFIESNKNKLPYKTEFYKTRNLAMFTYLSDLSNPATYPEMTDMNWDVVSVPTLKDKPGVGVQTNPTYWNIPNISKNKDAAMQIIKYLTSDEYQLILSKRGDLTSLKSTEIRKAVAAGLDEKVKKHNFQAFFYNNPAAPSSKTVYDTAAEKPISDGLIDLSLGKADLNTAIRKAEEAGNLAIEAAKKK